MGMTADMHLHYVVPGAGGLCRSPAAAAALGEVRCAWRVSLALVCCSVAVVQLPRRTVLQPAHKRCPPLLSAGLADVYNAILTC